MAVAIYMDVHIPRAITVGLRLRGVDVITAQEDNSANLADQELLERATALRRVLFTFDDDLLIEATKRQVQGNPFTGLIYAYPSRVSIGSCIRDMKIKGVRP